jgi:hypothetical protein
MYTCPKCFRRFNYLTSHKCPKLKYESVDDTMMGEIVEMLNHQPQIKLDDSMVYKGI